MRQLLPVVADVDPTERYLAATRPPPTGRPWVAVGMVQSIDGATATDGRSGPLGGPADRQVFRAVRAIADVILVGAGTVRAEHYGRVRQSPETTAARVAAGRSAEPARLAIVSGSLALDLDADCFSPDAARPVVFTGTRAPAARRTALEAVAEVRVVGDDRVDLRGVLASLAGDGVEVVVSEGGPSLNGALVEADLVDEWCLTVAPVVVGGTSARVVAAGADTTPPVAVTLDTLLEADGVLFGRWVRPSA